MHKYRDILRIVPEVLYALKHGQPVVSLQSTIISHGMPYPNNKICALQVEAIIRQNGCIPATIALIDGQICIGLDQNNIEQLARNGSKSRKVSRRDLPYVLAQKGLGSTTVAGTMICSALAGIDIFVTGGLGGVHRDFSETMDVSADLRQLGRTPVNVISAGVKNILDIPRTIQYLETQGVPVITYGSKYFPAFFTPSSGIQSPLSMNSLEQIANVLLMRKRLNLQNGCLVGVPAQDSGQGRIIQQSINKALKQAHQKGIKGAATTPFLLKRVHQLSGGVSITANINLIKRNAEIGAKLAQIYANKKKQSNIQQSYLIEKPGKIIVIGGCAVDYEVNITDKNFQLYQSCTGLWKSSIGGVGRNIAEVSKRLNSQTIFITALGSDKGSQTLKNNILSNGIQLHEIKSPNNAPTFLCILDKNKDSIIGVSDMKVNNQLTFQSIYNIYFKKYQKILNPNDIIIIDANISDQDENLLKLLKYLNNKGYFIIYQCKGTKSNRIINYQAYQYISLLKMNDKQRELIVNSLIKQGKINNLDDQYRWFGQNVGRKRKNNYLTQINTIITNGFQNIKIISKDSVKEIQVIKSNNVVKTTGAGDTMTGAFSSFLLKGYDIQHAIRLASMASKMTVQFQGVDSTISNKISIQKILKEFQLHKKNILL